MLFNLYSVISSKDFISLAIKRLKFMTPVYHLSNAIVIYTGTKYSCFYAQQFSLTIALSIPASIFTCNRDKRYKKQRVIKVEIWNFKKILCLC